jgi:hypothetical protein
VAPEVPEPVRKVVQRALNKEHGQRFPTAGQMRHALHGAVPSLGSMRTGRRPSDTQKGDASSAGLSVSIPRRAGQSLAALAQADDTAETMAEGPQTYVPDVTAPPSGSSVIVAGKGATRAALFAGLGLALAVIVVGGAVIALRHPMAPPGPSPSSAAQQEGALSAAYVDVLLQAARIDLQNKQYDSAIQGAQQALKEDAHSAEAKALLEQAQAAVRERDAVAQDAQAALARKDMNAASQALSRLLELDPRHPAVPQLSAALNATFQQRAEDGRRAAASARAEAAGQASTVPGFAEGDALLKQAEALLEKAEYAAATGKFAEARDAFGRAQRTALQQQAERQRQAEAQRLAQQRAAAQARAAEEAAAAARAAAAPSLAPATVPPVANVTAALPGPAANPQEAAIRQLMAQYERAMESKDMALLRSVWPTIAPVDQKKIEMAFKSVKSWDVGLRVEGIEVSGPRAVIRAARQDTINGTRTPAASQTFRLVQAADGWKIESIGQ